MAFPQTCVLPLSKSKLCEILWIISVDQSSHDLRHILVSRNSHSWLQIYGFQRSLRVIAPRILGNNYSSLTTPALFPMNNSQLFLKHILFSLLHLWLLHFCCDMGQNDTIGKIELNPLSSCQVIILIARMTFNCSSSCLMS